MLTILSILGLLWLMKCASKALTKVGTWMEMAAEQMTDSSVSKIRTKQNSAKALANITKVRETLVKIRGEAHPDDEYIAQVRDEINALTEKERE